MTLIVYFFQYFVNWQWPATHSLRNIPLEASVQVYIANHSINFEAM
jgi:hypothetical protein